MAYANNLKPGGILIITVPNSRSFNFMIYKSYHTWFDVPEHLFYFNSENLKKDLEAVGFSVKRIFTRNDKFSLLFLFLVSFKNMLKEKSRPTKPQAWKIYLGKAEERSLNKRRVKYIIIKTAELALYVFSKPLEFIASFFNLNDELWMVAQKIQ